jgi:RNA polymerase sigma-70 factor (sigma-E family)
MAGWDAPDTFTDFVTQRHVELLRFAHVLSGSRTLAEDLVQDALERTGTSWRRVRRQDDPEGYVRRIIVTRFLNKVRGFRREFLVDIPPEVQHPDLPYQSDDALWPLLSDLPKRQRAVVVLRYYADMPDTEIATLLDCSLGTVRSNASRALATLRTALQTTEAEVAIS